MPGMTTVLTVYSQKENSTTYDYAGNTAQKPKLVIQKRKPAVGSSGVMEDSFTVLEATEDADGNILTSKVSFEGKLRRPINGTGNEVLTALSIFRDVVASDEFTDMVTKSKLFA